MKLIATNYLSTWFAVDFLAVLPFQYLEPGEFRGSDRRIDVRELKLYRYLGLTRFLKLIRLMKYSRSINRLLNQLNKNQGVKRMLFVSITMFFLVHLIACIYYMTAMFADFNPNTWVAQKGILNEAPHRKYLFAFNWALQTLTTVGYGDVSPNNFTERLVSLVWMIVGVAFYSFTIGNLASIIS